MPLDRETLGRLQQLHEHATPGTWRLRPLQYDDWGWIRSDVDDHIVAETCTSMSLGRFRQTFDGEYTDDRWNEGPPIVKANAEFIIESHNHLPDLLAAAALGLAVQGLRERIVECFHDSDWGDEGKSRQVFSTYHGAKVLRDLLALLDTPDGAR